LLLHGTAGAHFDVQHDAIQAAGKLPAMIEAASRGIDSTVALVSRSAWSFLSSGAISADCPE